LQQAGTALADQDFSKPVQEAAMSIPANLMKAVETQFSRAGAAGVPQSVMSAVRQASARTGVDFSYLMEKAAQESSFNPTAKASTSSATGLYQFIERTWLDMVDQHGAEYGLDGAAEQIQRRSDGTPYVADAETRREILELRKDPRLSAFLAAEYTRDNQEQLQQSVGGDIGAAELYLAHFLGAGGASRFLNALHQDGDQSAAAFMPEAAAANRAVFYDKTGNPLSLAEVYDHFASRFEGAPSAATIIAAAQGGDEADGSELGMSSLRKGAGGGTSMSLFTVMVLSQLGTPIDEDAKDGEKGGGKDNGNADRDDGRLPTPTTPSLGAFPGVA
jgi:hypothetical protein